MANVSNIVAIRFADEKSWRNALVTIVQKHPKAKLNARGDLELTLPARLSDWAAALPGAEIIPEQQEAESASQGRGEPPEGRNEPPLYKDLARLQQWMIYVRNRHAALQDGLRKLKENR